MISDIEQRRRQFAPSAKSLRDGLPSMGESLRVACLALADDCTLPRIDELVARLKTAEQSLTRLRLAMVAEETTGWGTG